MRNSESAIVQLRYGDDGLNPIAMEDTELPVDFERLQTRVFAGRRLTNARFFRRVRVRWCRRVGETGVWVLDFGECSITDTRCASSVEVSTVRIGDSETVRRVAAKL